MYCTQSNPRHNHPMHSQNCGRGRFARRAAKREKFKAWMRANAQRHGHFQQPSTGPDLQLKEKDDQYEIHLFAAGMTKEAFDISLTDDILTITGKAILEKEPGQRFAQQPAYLYEGFKRKFSLNEKIDTDEISAEYENGVLIVSLQKKAGEERQHQSISVQ